MKRIILLLAVILGLAAGAGADIGNLPTTGLVTAFLPTCAYEGNMAAAFYGANGVLFPSYPATIGGYPCYYLASGGDKITGGSFVFSSGGQGWIKLKDTIALTNASTFTLVLKGKELASGIAYFDQYTDASNNMVLAVSSGGYIQFYYEVGGTLKYGFYENVSFGSAGTPYTIVITKNGATTSGYFNGTQLTYTNPAGYHESYTLGNYSFVTPINLGYYGGGFGTGNFTAFTHYNRVLTGTEITTVSSSAADFGLIGDTVGSGTDLILSPPTSITVNEYSPNGYAVAQALDGTGQPTLASTGTANCIVGGTITGETGDVYAMVRAMAGGSASTDSIIVPWTKILSSQTGTYAGALTVPINSGLYWDRMVVKVNSDTATTANSWGVGQVIWAGGQSNQGDGATVLGNRDARTSRDTAGSFVGMFFYGTCTPCDYWMHCTDSTILGGGCSMLPKLGTLLTTAWHCPIGLILGGVAGSALVDRVDSATSWGCFNIGSNDCIYGKNLGYELALSHYYETTPPNRKILAAVWWQGENEGTATVNAVQWPLVFDSLQTHMRADLGVPNLPIFCVQMSKDLYHAAVDTAWSVQRSAVYNVDNSCVPAFDLPQSDSFHVRWDSQDSVGNRMAYRMVDYFAGTPYVNPRIISATITGTHTIRVKCNKTLATTSTIANDSLYRNGAAMTITSKSALNDTITYTTTDSTNGTILYRYFYGANPGGTALNATVANVLRAADGSPVLPISTFINASTGGSGGLDSLSPKVGLRSHTIKAYGHDLSSSIGTFKLNSLLCTISHWYPDSVLFTIPSNAPRGIYNSPQLRVADTTQKWDTCPTPFRVSVPWIINQ